MYLVSSAKSDRLGSPQSIGTAISSEVKNATAFAYVRISGAYVLIRQYPIPFERTIGGAEDHLCPALFL